MPTMPNVMNEVDVNESVNTDIININISKPTKKNNYKDLSILNLLLVLKDENNTKKKCNPFNNTNKKA